MKYFISTLSALLIISCSASAEEIIHIGSQCYIPDYSKTAQAAACVAAIRASGKVATEGDILNCNIQTGLLSLTKCP